MYEGMRIHPPAQILMVKRTPPEGDSVLGHHIPGGTKIAWNQFALMRDKELFGDDAYLFRPERWLAVGSEKRQEMERHVELIFGYGKYICSGKQVALSSLNRIFVEVCLSCCA